MTLRHLPPPKKEDGILIPGKKPAEEGPVKFFKEIKTEHKIVPTAITFLNSEKNMITSSLDGRILVLDRKKESFDILVSKENYAFACLSYSLQRNLLAVGSMGGSGWIGLWNMKIRKQIYSKRFENGVGAIAISSNGKYLAVGFNDVFQKVKNPGWVEVIQIK